MELMDVINNRQSVRKYLAEPVPEGDVKKMVEAARLAPSAKNLQNWHFVAIRDKEVMADVMNVVSDKNRAIADEMSKVDEEKGARFARFAEHFTLFAADAPLVFAVMATEYIPSGYNEMALIGKEAEARADLIELRNPGLQNIGAAVENLYLRANELGYGACWITSANYAGKEIEDYLAEKNIFADEKYYFVCLVSVGKQDGEAKSPQKKSLEDILTLV
jgi:nitroreductase